MNIAFGAEYDGLHDIGECGYEWWYYDCVSEDSEFAVVLIIFRDIPMLPECIKERTLSPKKRGYYYDGISINVYHKKRRLLRNYSGVKNIKLLLMMPLTAYIFKIIK
ncbi:MAG: hypothetical protein IPK11_11515 [Ignavibacteria bacterium]|nr:hypothetical protein [Ignavibacteria bacterium]